MTDFKVTDWLSLGEAVSESVSGDRILVESGNYAVMPIKNGVTCICPEDFSVKVGMTPFWMKEKFNSGAIKRDGLRVENISHAPDIIKGIYVYRKKLPFDVHLKSPTPFIHANGVIINALGNDRDGLLLKTGGEGGDDFLPKGVVDICIPFIEEIHFPMHFIGMTPTMQEILDQDLANHKVLEFESRLRAPGLHINDMEYRALWAFNSFITIYGSHTNQETKLIGYSATEFMDNMLSGKSNNIDDTKLAEVTCIGVYNSQMVVSMQSIQDKMLDAQVFSMGKYIVELMNRLNYPQATVAMCQGIEERYGADKAKYEAINRSENLNETEQQYLTEIILCRNSLLHCDGKFQIDKSIRDLPRAQEKYPNIAPMTEFYLYATKRPWYWFAAYTKLMT